MLACHHGIAIPDCEVCAPAFQEDQEAAESRLKAAKERAEKAEATCAAYEQELTEACACSGAPDDFCQVCWIRDVVSKKTDPNVVAKILAEVQQARVWRERARKIEVELPRREVWSLLPEWRRFLCEMAVEVGS